MSNLNPNIYYKHFVADNINKSNRTIMLLKKYM